MRKKNHFACLKKSIKLFLKNYIKNKASKIFQLKQNSTKI